MAVKILIAAFGFYPETHGIAQAAYHQAMGLHRLDYEITVVTQASDQPRNVPFAVVSFPVRYRRFSLLPQRKVITAYQRFILESDADVFFFHGWETWVSEWVIPILPQLKGKTVLISHGTTIHLRYPGFKGWLRWLLNRSAALGFSGKLRMFDWLVFLSPHPDPQRMSDVVEAKRLGITDFSIIPNGANPAFLRSSVVDFRTKFGIPNATILLCVGNFMREKGQRELVRWFRELALKNTVLVLIGSRFNEYSAQLSKAAGTHLNVTVFLFEQLTVEDIHAAYSAATIFVSATYTEVQPLVLLDAMAVGVPFLCREVGAVKELKGGLCFRTKREFSKKLRWLLRHPLSRSSLGEKGRKSVQEKYNWDKSALLWHALIQRLIQGIRRCSQ
ncbi:glycosyltransferase family 4 protein [Runella slithyformis]|uniref:glycosyltransferase family 4 protein n=1 Tax=Runella slithyformis TaxID=106 RepID=UPI00146E7017|nr:glycosyltransferase family 4 protein [Runella slithyformis]